MRARWRGSTASWADHGGSVFEPAVCLTSLNHFDGALESSQLLERSNKPKTLDGPGWESFDLIILISQGMRM